MKCRPPRRDFRPTKPLSAHSLPYRSALSSPGLSASISIRGAFPLDRRTEYLGRTGNADLPGNCSRHRQSRLHYHLNRETTGARSTESPSGRANVGVADADPLVVLYLLADHAVHALVQPFWKDLVRQGYGVTQRRALSDCQGYTRHP